MCTVKQYICSVEGITLLLYKRLDNGRYRWPRTECEAKQLTSQQLRWLMEGLEIEQKKAIKPGQRKCLY